MNGRSLGYLLVLGSATLFGINAGVARIPLRSGTDEATFTTVRITCSLLVLIFVALASRRPAMRQALRPPPLRSWPIVVGMGALGVAGLQGFYNVAINRLPLGVALLLEYLGPVIVVLWVRFVRREPVQARLWPALGLILAGLAVVSRVDEGLKFDGLGVAFALLAACCFAFYFLLGEHSAVSAEPFRFFLWAFVVAAVVSNAIAPIWGATTLFTDASMLGRLSDYTVPATVAMAGVVIGGTVVPFFAILLALRYLPATVVSTIAMLEPAIAAVVGWIWFAESLTPGQVAGLCAVLCGIWLAQSARPSRTTQRHVAEAEPS